TLCNEARLALKDGTWKLAGDPTEGALVTLAMKAGVHPDRLRDEVPAVDTIPFESERRYMASLHPDAERGSVVYVKGAPERVLDMCASQFTPDGDAPLDRAQWERSIDALARRGQRVLALARRSMPADASALSHDDVRAGLTLLGLVGLIDPPREDAIEAVRQCQSAGI